MKCIPRWLRNFNLDVINDLLLVVVVGLVFLGAGSLIGLNAKELLSDFTPLLLGLFGIAITVSSLKVTIKEGRERALRERNDAVRPVLVMVEHNPKGKDTYFLQCFVNSGSGGTDFNVTLKNAGLGAALNIEFLLHTEMNKLYRVVPAVQKLSADESCALTIFYTLPSRLTKVISSYEDVYGNTHYCYHHVNMSGTEVLPVLYNYYIDSEEEQEACDILEEAFDGPIWTQADRLEEEAILEEANASSDSR